MHATICVARLLCYPGKEWPLPQTVLANRECDAITSRTLFVMCYCSNAAAAMKMPCASLKQTLFQQMTCLSLYKNPLYCSASQRVTCFRMHEADTEWLFAARAGTAADRVEL